MITITELLEEHNVEYKTTNQHSNVREGWIGIDCPFCGNGSGKYHLGINLNSKHGTCWRCGWHNLVHILMEVTNRNYFICNSWVDKLDIDSTIESKYKKRGKLKVPNGVGPLLNTHKKYLKKRGFDVEELVAKWNVQGTGYNSTHPWKIFIPITHYGKTVSWVARSVKDEGGRYFFPKPEHEIMSPKHFLFGEHHCLYTVIVVEGPFDLFRIGYGAAALMGISYTQEQFECLSKFYRRVICFDNEPEAQRRAKKLCEDLSCFSGETINVNLDAPDPGSASKREIILLKRSYLCH